MHLGLSWQSSGLRLHPSNAEGASLILVEELRSHVPYSQKHNTEETYNKLNNIFKMLHAC